MNSGVDEIHDFVKIKVQSMTNKKGKQVTFTYQLPSQATANLRNQGASSSYPHRPQLSEMVSSIMMNSLPIKKRDSGAPMIMSEIGGMSFTRSLLDTGASINILPKDVFDRHHVWVITCYIDIIKHDFSCILKHK